MARLPLSTMADWNYVGGSIGHARRFWTERGSSQRRSRRALGGRHSDGGRPRHIRTRLMSMPPWTRCEAQVVAQDVGTT